MKSNATQPVLIRSYLELRRAVGYIGMALPVVLLVGKMIFDGAGIEPSISDYYYTVMGDVFVGSLFVIGVFLWSYKGYEEGPDNKIGNIACIGAVGTALFPTTPDSPSLAQEIVGYFHYLFAVGFLSMLAYFSKCLFTRTNQKKPTAEKLIRNKIYRCCGYAIAGSIMAMIVFVLTKRIFKYTVPEWLDVVFWLETIAVMSFGFSWIVKGKVLFRDQVIVHPRSNES
jgi:magnesium-transporting ATPase (P-type)